MDMGILLISISDDTTPEEMKAPMPNPYRTGGWVVVKQVFVERVLDGPSLEFALKHRFMFIVDEAWDSLGLPRESY
jgi:hypothetical protein